ncbi:hypothetical protein KY290_018923 [Solanum tuberosum]|uniref:Uncharacterized protein n=1 Tax=Solanum tuberosum TaxID=4113 RepID=A0ABQ7VIJ4_SOLTU|nr:hypothetical protein KY290_018923 [Solanum tuberosum]
MSIYLERNCAKDATPDQICGDDYAYRPCIAGRLSYKIKAGTASVSDAISTNYSDFTANCTSIQVQIHKSLIPCSRSYAILLSCYNSMTLKPMYNTISDAESVNLEISMV